MNKWYILYYTHTLYYTVHTYLVTKHLLTSIASAIVKNTTRQHTNQRWFWVKKHTHSLARGLGIDDYQLHIVEISRRSIFVNEQYSGGTVLNHIYVLPASTSGKHTRWRWGWGWWWLWIWYGYGLLPTTPTRISLSESCGAMPEFSVMFTRLLNQQRMKRWWYGDGFDSGGVVSMRNDYDDNNSQ